jgi:hypothetical protein
MPPGLVDSSFFLTAFGRHPSYSYIPERMTMPEIEKRLAVILETDWKAEATAIFSKRENSDADTHS